MIFDLVVLFVLKAEVKYTVHDSSHCKFEPLSHVTECRDDNKNCVQWMEYGYCSTSEVVSRLCTKSCSRCDQTIVENTGEKGGVCTSDLQAKCERLSSEKGCKAADELVLKVSQFIEWPKQKYSTRVIFLFRGELFIQRCLTQLT